jgi:hypothetical protein
LKAGARGRSLGRPANVRVTGVDLSPKDHDYVRRRLGMKLGKFSPSIERITLRLSDVNLRRSDHTFRLDRPECCLATAVVTSRRRRVAWPAWVVPYQHDIGLLAQLLTAL